MSGLRSASRRSRCSALYRSATRRCSVGKNIIISHRIPPEKQPSDHADGVSVVHTQKDRETHTYKERREKPRNRAGGEGKVHTNAAGRDGHTQQHRQRRRDVNLLHCKPHTHSHNNWFLWPVFVTSGNNRSDSRRKGVYHVGCPCVPALFRP